MIATFLRSKVNNKGAQKGHNLQCYKFVRYSGDVIITAMAVSSGTPA
jgi:hypothetical protein